MGRKRRQKSDQDGDGTPETEGRRKVLKALNTFWFFLSQMTGVSTEASGLIRAPKYYKKGIPGKKRMDLS